MFECVRSNYLKGITSPVDSRLALDHHSLEIKCDSFVLCSISVKYIIIIKIIFINHRRFYKVHFII